jgi:hypothetical protein
MLQGFYAVRNVTFYTAEFIEFFNLLLFDHHHHHHY